MAVRRMKGLIVLLDSNDSSSSSSAVMVGGGGGGGNREGEGVGVTPRTRMRPHTLGGFDARTRGRAGRATSMTIKESLPMDVMLILKPCVPEG